MEELETPLAIHNIASVVDSRPATSRGPSLIYGTITEYDAATKLSTVEILDEEVSNVPKLQHVDFGGGREAISSGLFASGGEDLVVSDIPSAYEGYDLEIWGRCDDEQNVAIHLNAVNTNYTTGFADIKGTATVTADQASGGLYCARWNTTSGYSIINIRKITNNLGQYFWQCFAHSGVNSSTESVHSIYLTSGIYLSANQPITSMRFRVGASGGSDFIDFGYRLWGLKPFKDPVGQNVLCIRDALVPLTIIGVLDGETV